MMNNRKSGIPELIERLEKITITMREARKNREYYFTFLDKFVQRTGNQYVDTNCYTTSQDIIWLAELQEQELGVFVKTQQETKSLLMQICVTLSIPPYEIDINLMEQLAHKEDQLERFLFISQLQSTIMRLTELEYEVAYESTVYSQLIKTIFTSIEKYQKQSSQKTKSEMVKQALIDTEQFLATLDEKQLGELAIEHYSENYNRNIGIFIDAMSHRFRTSFEEFDYQDEIFKSTLEALNNKLHHTGINGVERLLNAIEQTAFYQKHWKAGNEGWQKKIKSEV